MHTTTTAIGTSATSAAAAALLKTTVPQAVPQVQLDAGAGAALCGDELRARAATSSPRGAHPQAVRAREAGTTTTTTTTSTTSTGR